MGHTTGSGKGEFDVTVRAARIGDVTEILNLVADLVGQRVLVAKDDVEYYENIQEFLVVEDTEGAVLACGAIHVMWEDLAEVRTLAVDPAVRGLGLGGKLLEALCAKASNLGVRRLFCLTFEIDFFNKHGFGTIEETFQENLVTDIYRQLLLSSDEGVAEFLELARVRPNTLGNTRMIKYL